MQAGDIITVDFGIPAGSGPGFEHPAIVVTADLIVAQMPRTFHVVPVTSKVHRAMATDVPVDGERTRQELGRSVPPTDRRRDRARQG